MLYLCTTTAAQPSHAFPNGAFAANLGTGEEEVVMEMNPQQKEFLEMSEEFTEPDDRGRSHGRRSGAAALLPFHIPELRLRQQTPACKQTKTSDGKLY